MKQERKLTGVKFDNVDVIYQPDPATLERLRDWWRRSRRMGGPRSRMEQRRRKRAAAAEATGAPPSKTSAQAATSPSVVCCPLDTAASTFVATGPSTSASVATEPSASSIFRTPFVFPVTTATTTLSSSYEPVVTSVCAGAVFSVRETAPACRPAGYHSSPSPSCSSVGSEVDESVFGDMSPERLHPGLTVLEEARRSLPGQMAEGQSIACQTELVSAPTPPQPPSPELFFSLQNEVFNIVIAQPTWPPSRVRRAALHNLGL